MEGTKTHVICTSVFKSGENAATKSGYTKKWLELINRLEKSKDIRGIKG